jgi:hypothetical protein
MAVPSTPDTSFELNLRSSANKSLWTSVNFDGDGLWILSGMLNHSLVIVHNGSHMKDISLTVSSAATIIYYTVSKARCKCTWAEQSESSGYYCREILGGIMTQLILKAAATRHNKKIPNVGVDYDNNGIVTHGNDPCNPLLTTQTQADLLQVFKNLVANQPVRLGQAYLAIGYR